MAKSSPRVRATLAAATLAAAAVTGITLAASAGATTVETDDPRAEAHDGRTQDSCSFVGLAGERVDLANIEFEGGDDQQSVTIISIADGLDVTGIVVKGGSGYNLYEPGERELAEAPEWADLVAPLVSSDSPADISHWFICAEGEPEEPTTTPPSQTTTTVPDDCESAPKDCETTTPPTEPPTTTPQETTTPPTETTTPQESTTPAGDDEESSTPAPAPVPDGDDDDLALTGFDAGWLIPVGLLLLLGGGAVLWLARTRRNMV